MKVLQGLDVVLSEKAETSELKKWIKEVEFCRWARGHRSRSCKKPI